MSLMSPRRTLYAILDDHCPSFENSPQYNTVREEDTDMH